MKYDQADFFEQFEGLPMNAMVAIALRGAMRVLPILAFSRGPDRKGFAYWKAGPPEYPILALFGCYQTSSFLSGVAQADGRFDIAANAARYAAIANVCADAAADTTAIQACVHAAAYVASAAAAAAAAADDDTYDDDTPEEVTTLGSVRFTAASAVAFIPFAALAATDAISADIKRIGHVKHSCFDSAFDQESHHQAEVAKLLVSPLWPEGEPQEFRKLRTQLEADLQNLEAGFEIWIDWYRARLDGKRPDWEIERQWALPNEQLAQSPKEINACLKELRDGAHPGPGDMPINLEKQSAEVFLSYSHKDGAAVEALCDELKSGGFSVWYDAGLIAGQPYRDVLQERIETVKAVVVLWTENSIGSKWVRWEADFADQHGKLICLRDPGLDPKRIPPPFAANDHIVEAGKLEALLKALALKGAKPKV